MEQFKNERKIYSMRYGIDYLIKNRKRVDWELVVWNKDFSANNLKKCYRKGVFTTSFLIEHLKEFYLRGRADLLQVDYDLLIEEMKSRKKSFWPEILYFSEYEESHKSAVPLYGIKKVNEDDIIETLSYEKNLSILLLTSLDLVLGTSLSDKIIEWFVNTSKKKISENSSLRFSNSQIALNNLIERIITYKEFSEKSFWLLYNSYTGENFPLNKLGSSSNLSTNDWSEEFQLLKKLAGGD